MVEVVRSDLPAVQSQRVTGVGVDIEPGEVAAGDVDPDAVAFFDEDISSGEGLDDMI